MPTYMPAWLRGSMKWKAAASRTPGNGRKRTASIHEKTMVFTPMPTPSDATTTAASAGIRAMERKAYRRS